MEIVSEIWKNEKKNIILVAILVIGVYIFPFNLIGLLIWFNLGSWVRLLYNDISKKQNPQIKKYVKTTLITSFIVALFIFLITMFKGFGLIGFGVLVLGLAVFKIWRGRKLFVKTSKYLGELIKNGNK